MPGWDIVAALGIGVSLILLGALTWKHPLWVHKAGYRWIALIGSELMRPRHRKDMELLFNKPAEWTAQHRFTVAWTRMTMGCGALVIGLLVIGLSLAVWNSRMLR
jgi:hypothetical protein